MAQILSACLEARMAIGTSSFAHVELQACPAIGRGIVLRQKRRNGSDRGRQADPGTHRPDLSQRHAIIHVADQRPLGGVDGRQFHFRVERQHGWPAKYMGVSTFLEPAIMSTGVLNGMGAAPMARA